MRAVVSAPKPGTRIGRIFLAGFLVGLAAGSGVAVLWSGRTRQADFTASESPGGPFSFPSMLRQASADLEVGDYEFFPNRRSVWIVNRTNGRMANYHFHDDELGSVDRSRVSTLDLKTFPRQDTVLYLSDRNMNNILWVCNMRTGDVQMWTIARDGSLRAETPVASAKAGEH